MNFINVFIFTAASTISQTHPAQTPLEALLVKAVTVNPVSFIEAFKSSTTELVTSDYMIPDFKFTFYNDPQTLVYAFKLFSFKYLSAWKISESS